MSDAPSAREDQPVNIFSSYYLKLVCAISITTIVGQSVIAPVLPTIQHALAVTPEQIGLVITAFTLPGIFFVPITGVLADRYGRRKVVVPMLFLYGAAGAASGLATDFETLLAMRFLTGIGAGSLGSLSLVLVGDYFADRDRSRVFGIRMALGQGGNAIVPLLAGVIAIFGWQYPFLLYGLAIPVGMYAMRVMEPDRPEGGASLGDYLRKTWLGISNRRVSTLLVIPFALTIINHGINLVFLPIFMDVTFGSSAVAIGLIVTTRVTIGALIALKLGSLVQRFGEFRLLYFSFVTLAASMVLTPLMPSEAWMILPALLYGITTGIAFPSFQTILVRQAPRGILGGVMAANSMTTRLGQTIGPLLGGLVYGVGGLTMVFMGAATIAVAALIFALVMFNQAELSVAPGE